MGERGDVYNSCNKSMGWHCIGTDWFFLGCFCYGEEWETEEVSQRNCLAGSVHIVPEVEHECEYISYIIYEYCCVMVMCDGCSSCSVVNIDI